MLILDGDKLKEWERQKAVDRTREVTFGGARDESRDRHWVADPETSVANVARQMGRKLTPEEFMKKLHTINPDIVLEPHPGQFAPKHTGYYRLNRDKAVLKLNTNGQKIYLFVCEGDIMPEWSIFDTQKVKVPDATDPSLPWREVEIPWHVTKRGWREVLLKLIVEKKLVTLEAVERVFGAGDRPSWKILTGKGSGESIF